MERFDRIARRRPWYKQARRTYLKRAIIVAVVMVTLAAISFYQIVTSISKTDHFPAKTITELLDALESQIIEPEG